MFERRRIYISGCFPANNYYDLPVCEYGDDPDQGVGGGDDPVGDPEFITTWKTDNTGTSTDEQITVPTITGATYDCTVDWGDGTTDTITTFDDAAWTHTYPVAGTYQVKINGEFGRIFFSNNSFLSNGGDRLKLLSVDQWGTTANWSSFRNAFYGCENCRFNATDTLVLPADCYSAFRSCFIFNESVSAWDTSNVTNMSYMFRNCFAFNQNLSNFSTTNVTDMSFMFGGSTAFNQSVANFNTSNVTTTYGMFWSAVNFNQSVANFNTSNVTTMYSMFRDCSAFKQSLGTFSLAGLANDTSLYSFLQSTNINETGSTANLDATLVGWAAQLPLAFAQQVAHLGDATYSTLSGKPAYDELVSAGWFILTGGEDI